MFPSGLGTDYPKTPPTAVKQAVRDFRILSNPHPVSEQHTHTFHMQTHAFFTILISIAGRAECKTDLFQEAPRSQVRQHLGRHILAESQDALAKSHRVNSRQVPSLFQLPRFSGMKHEPSQVNIWDKAVRQYKSNRCGFLPSPPTCVEPCPRSASCSAPPATTQNRNRF